MVKANRKIFCSISKNINNGLSSIIRKRSKDFQTKIYQTQRKVADFVKRHRTIKLLHLFRKYSAFAVVVSGAVLVTATNLAAEGKSAGLLAGEWKGDKKENVKKDIAAEAEKEMQNSLKPTFVASRAVDPEFKEENNSEIINGAEGKIVAAPTSPVLKDPQEGEGLSVYEVQSGDTVGSIALSHGITTNTILWANDIDDVDSIMPGDKLFILPVAGLTHVVKKGETIDEIAKEYEAEKDKIISFNELPADGEIKEDQEITIPGGVKEIPEPVQDDSLIARRNYATPSGGSPDVSGFKKLDGKAGSGHSFPYGYCTWYVAQKRYVPWGGNAGTWLYNAKARGYKTGKEPKKGAILVTSESWWGHVAVVEKVKGNTITVSEMNYKGWGKTSTRTISTSNRVIKGYIY
jgi:surface antigen/LysM repeat protein